MKKTLLVIAAVAFLAGCSSAPKVNEFGIVENAAVTVKKAGPEETWAEFAGAVERNRADVVKELLAQGVSPNTLVEDGDPALVRAIRMDNQPVIKLLLAAPGIDVNTQSRLGEDALMLAAFKGDKELFNTAFSARRKGQ